MGISAGAVASRWWPWSSRPPDLTARSRLLSRVQRATYGRVVGWPGLEPGTNGLKGIRSSRVWPHVFNAFEHVDLDLSLI